MSGRDFLPGDEIPGAAPVMILSYKLWQSRYSGEDSIVGRTLRVNDRPTQVIGVLARGVTFPGATDLWLPLVQTAAMKRRDSRTLTMFGRLAPGASLRSARSQLNVIAVRLADRVSRHQQKHRRAGAELQRALQQRGHVAAARLAAVGGRIRAPDCVRQRREPAAGSSGCARARGVDPRQPRCEPLARDSSPPDRESGSRDCRRRPRLPAGDVGRADIRRRARSCREAPLHRFFDRRNASSAISSSSRSPPRSRSASRLRSRCHGSTSTRALKEGSNAAGQGRRVRFVSALLVVTEVSLSVVLLVGAGLMVRSLMNTNRADIGIDTGPILSMALNLRPPKYPTVERRVLFYDQLIARLERLPAIEAAAVTSDLPAESPDDFVYDVEGGPPAAGDARPRTASLIVGENYFRVMGVSPKSGRVFAETDVPAGLPVAIVNEAFVNEACRGQDPIGKRVRLVETSRDAPPSPGPWLTVVGVVSNILQDDESFEVSPVVYLSYRQQPTGAEVVVRTRVPPATVGETIRREVQSLDDGMAVRGLRTLDESLWFRNWRYRVFGAMFAIFAVIALVLASVGLYAVVAHSVSQRTREIGVRMTLGATSRAILALVFRQGLTQLAVGLIVGGMAALAATSVLRAMLVGVTPADPLTFGAVALVLALAGVLGCAIPGRRAIRVDPVIALRRE